MLTDQLTAELCTVAELFEEDDATYTIPPYQRNYAWRSEQIEQLIDDVYDAQNAQDPHNSDGTGYFLGNLVVTKRTGSATTDYEVIDGQQRLTTLYLLLTVLDEFSEHSYRSHVDRLRYESRPRAAAALRRVVNIGGNGTTWDPEAATDEDAGIHEAHNIICQYLKQHPRLQSSENRRQIAAYLRESVTLVRAVLPKETDLNRYFEIMNTRGQQLHQVDIVKARLMSSLPEAEQAFFAWIWDACADMDAYLQLGLTRGDTDLRSRLFGDKWSWLEPMDYEELRSTWEDTHATSADATRRYEPLSLDAALRKYAATASEAPAEESHSLAFRSTIEFPVFLLHVLKVHRGDTEEQEGALDDKRLIKEFEETIPDNPASAEKWTREFTLRLLRLRSIFDGCIIKRSFTGTQSEDGEWSLQQIRLRPERRRGQDSFSYRRTFHDAHDESVQTAHDDLLTLQSMLRVTYTSPRTMHWITRVLRLVEKAGPREVTAQDLIEELRDWTRGKIREGYPSPFPFPKPSGENSGSPENTGRSPNAFSIPRIVFTYLDYLILKREDRIGTFTYTFRTSVEHFYPQGIDPEQTGAAVSPENLHRLGNLALVSVSMNSKFSNQQPEVKAKNYWDSIIKQSPKLQLMAKAALADGGWDDLAVKTHQDDMHKLLEKDVYSRK